MKKIWFTYSYKIVDIWPFISIKPALKIFFIIYFFPRFTFSVVVDVNFFFISLRSLLHGIFF